MIARQLQFDAVKHSVLHLNQLGGIVQRSTEDAGLFLIHLVRSGWAKGLKTSVVAFFFCSKIYNAVLDRSPRQTIYNK